MKKPTVASLKAELKKARREIAALQAINESMAGTLAEHTMHAVNRRRAIMEGVARSGRYTREYGA